jgi:hypothetical protein
MRLPHLFPLLLGLTLGATLAHDASAAKPSAKEAKVDVYIEMLNTESNFVFDNRAGYAKWVDMKAGPTCNEVGLRQPSMVGDSAPDRYAHYRKELVKKPKLDADDAAMQMVEALEQLRAPINEANDYYFNHKYRQDACKRGKELHPLLVAGWQKFIQGDEVVRSFVEKFNNERAATVLADDLKKYGKGFHWTQQKLLLDAKAMVRAVEGQKPTKDLLATFAQTLTDANALVAKEKGGKLSDVLYQGGYEQLLTRAGWYRDAVDSFQKELDKEAADPKADRTDDRKRAFKQVIDSYNHMVEQSNDTEYSKAMK